MPVLLIVGFYVVGYLSMLRYEHSAGELRTICERIVHQRATVAQAKQMIRRTSFLAGEAESSSDTPKGATEMFVETAYGPSFFEPVPWTRIRFRGGRAESYQLDQFGLAI